jgi:hypothetical protein
MNHAGEPCPDAQMSELSHRNVTMNRKVWFVMTAPVLLPVWERPSFAIWSPPMTHLKNKTSEQRQIETEQFFAELEQQIVRQLREEASSPGGREELMRSTGIHDAKLIEELGRLGITADGLLALRLFPLVLVAWAEKAPDPSKREAVMAEAVQLGVREGSTAWVLLDQWLQKRPLGIGVDAWRRYTHEMFSEMSDTAKNSLIELTEKQMTSVAKASGGHLGFGKESAKEKAMIHQVIESMKRQR